MGYRKGLGRVEEWWADRQASRQTSCPRHPSGCLPPILPQLPLCPDAAPTLPRRCRDQRFKEARAQRREADRTLILVDNQCLPRQRNIPAMPVAEAR